MKIEFDQTLYHSDHVSHGYFDSLSEFRDCLGYLLDDELWFPPFDSACIRVIDDNGILVSEVSLVREPTHDLSYEIVVSLCVGSDVIRVSRYHQNIIHFWHYLQDCILPCEESQKASQ